MAKNIELSITAKDFSSLFALTEKLNELNALLEEHREYAYSKRNDVSEETFEISRKISKLNAYRKSCVNLLGNTIYEIMQEYISDESEIEF